ncbi:MAG TPA: IS6 family transposase, partial [Ktedonobacteraceae bacterium]|nr:IS6 family transposase [Ktedonobacteraceae bacterium]
MCTTTNIRKRAKKTKLGYATFFCSKCYHVFNERTGTRFNYLEFPTDIVLLAVLWRLRYKLSYRDIAEMFFTRGFVFTHETVRDWEARFAPLIADRLRTNRRGQAGTAWYV